MLATLLSTTLTKQIPLYIHNPVFDLFIGTDVRNYGHILGEWSGALITAYADLGKYNPRSTKHFLWEHTSCTYEVNRSHRKCSGSCPDPWPSTLAIEANFIRLLLRATKFWSNLHSVSWYSSLHVSLKSFILLLINESDIYVMVQCGRSWSI